MAVATLLVGPVDHAAAQPASVGASEDPAGAARLLDLANRDRVAAGLAPLRVMPELVTVAQEQSHAMAAAGKIFHNAELFSSSLRDSINAGVLGENVAFDTGGITHAHWMLMNSPPHRANILDPRFTAAGFAITMTDGTAYITEVFAQVGAAPAPAPVVAAPAPAPPPPPPPPPPAPPTTQAAPPPQPPPPTTETPPTPQAIGPRPTLAPEAPAEPAVALAQISAATTPYDDGLGHDPARLSLPAAAALVLVNLALGLRALRARRTVAAV
jgi:hypothetical protein